MSDCCPTPGLPTPAVVGPAIPREQPSPCDLASWVKICEVPPAVPVSATGVDCLGAPVIITDPNVVLTVPAPGTVQMVQICQPTGEQDREYSTLCAPDGTKVLVVTAWSTSAPLGTAPVVETYTLAGAAYTGDRSLLTDCAAEKLDIVAEQYCAGGFPYERISFYDVSVNPPTLSSTLWRDSSGTAVADPGPGFIGACPALVADRPVLIYLERNAGVTAMADIVAAAGTPHIQSVTVKQIQGTGSVRGDSGSGAPLSAGETWSWSAVTSDLAWDHLGASALSMDAGGGEQRITATYIP